MRGRMVAAFVAGVLCCAMFLGAGVGAFYALSDDAQAQSETTWQVQYFSTLDYPRGANVEDIEAWVNTLPAECSLVSSSQINLLYYSCPAS